jgi:hypothetical protein
MPRRHTKESSRPHRYHEDQAILPNDAISEVEQLCREWGEVVRAILSRKAQEPNNEEPDD